MISITLLPSLIVLRNSIKLFEHWLRCYFLLTVPNEIIFNYYSSREWVNDRRYFTSL